MGVGFHEVLLLLLLMVDLPVAPDAVTSVAEDPLLGVWTIKSSSI